MVTGQNFAAGLLIGGALFLMLLAGGCERKPAPVTASSVATNPPAGTDVASSAATRATIPFAEATTGSGVDFTYHNGQEADRCSILESLGGGVGMLDFDRDGLVDLCFPGGGEFFSTPDSHTSGLKTGLYQNQGDFHFRDVGDVAGVQPCELYSHGAAAGDFNDDGFPDLLITGYGGVLLWINRGDGTFYEGAHAAGLDANRWSSSAAWCDLTGDGWLDLYVANYVNWSFDNDPLCRAPGNRREICSPKSFEALPHYVYINNGDGTFVDASADSGIRSDGKGLGVVAADFDDDHDVDVYVANDTTPNFLYVNDGHGRLDEVGLLRGVALDDQGRSNGSMGADVCDYNEDGRPDLWVTNYEHEMYALYRNEGSGYFLHVSQATGITALGQLFVGFGTACGDLDGDGDEDIAVANGHVIKYPTGAPRRQAPILLENRDRRFLRVEAEPGNYFAKAHEGRGLAIGDLDQDGDLDLVVSHLNDPVSLLKNNCQVTSWCSIDLVGTSSNRDAIGARVTFETTSGGVLRLQKGGASYLSTHDHRLHMALPKNTVVEKIIVYWPNGQQQQVTDPPLNRTLVVVEKSND